MKAEAAVLQAASDRKVTAAATCDSDSAGVVNDGGAAADAEQARELLSMPATVLREVDVVLQLAKRLKSEAVNFVRQAVSGELSAGNGDSSISCLALENDEEASRARSCN